MTDNIQDPHYNDTGNTYNPGTAQNPQQPQYNNPQSPEEEEIDIKAIVYTALNNWLLFTISIILLLGLAHLYLKRQPAIYESKASVLIKTDQRAPEEMFLLEDMGFNSMMGKENIDNEIGVLKSPDLIARIITSLELNTVYHREGRFGFYSPELYKNSPLYVRMEGVEPEKIPTRTEFTFTPSGTGFDLQSQYTLQGEEFNHSTTLDTLPTYLELPIGIFYIARQNDHTGQPRQFGNEPLKVSVCNAMQIARSYIQQLDIQPSTKTSTLLDITIKTPHRAKGEDFIAALISEYNRDAVQDKNTIAYNTSVFIEERLREISSELGEVEGQVEQFRQEHKVADIEAQVESYITRGETYETRRMEIETKLNLIRFIDEFIKNPDNRNKSIPNLGIEDPGLVALINEYNTLLLNKERIESSTSAENPSLKQITQQVNNMHQNIAVSLSNEIRAAQIALADLERENTITNKQIGNVPTLERQFTDILRQQEVKSNLYTFLLQKREETNLTQAAVAPKAKIIARPYSGNSPVSPKKPMIYAIFFMLGVALPAAYLFVRNYFRTKIEGVKDLEHLNNATLVGDIMKNDHSATSGENLVVKPDDDSVINEMFRTLRNNLLFMTHERDHNIILVTSTIPKEGKTFISANLARSLSLMDKKVLLIGADLRNPQVGSFLGLNKEPRGLSSYLAGHVNDYNEIIQEAEPNLYVMLSGAIPPNPNELLSNKRTGQMLNTLRREFDYIVIDTAPVGVVSDTFMIARYAHATLYVVRENFSEKDTIHFINNLATDRRLKNIGVVLNQTTLQKGIGAQNYGYKYTYRYKYRYSYGYSQDKENGQ
jgi:capsular exopolysaccharide synthesis family protein